MIGESLGDVTFTKGGFLKPSRLSFLSSTGHHEYEFSGMWDVGTFLDALRG